MLIPLSPFIYQDTIDILCIDQLGISGEGILKRRRYVKFCLELECAVLRVFIYYH